MLDEVVEAYPNDVVVYFKHFPLSTHPHSEAAARAAVAAHRQGRFADMHRTLLENQTAQTDQDILQYAERLGLDMERFKRDWADPDVAALVRKDKEEGLAAHVEGTPTLFINGALYSDPPALPFLKDWIEEILSVNG
ncbi:MAG: hypothetical protein D6689_14025 [Deltaproteobacteria bacterium]|nr:MAG: hypothetical protein D6689_14025 [Deltaproteobacteria bacterium]